MKLSLKDFPTAKGYIIEKEGIFSHNFNSDRFAWQCIEWRERKVIFKEDKRFWVKRDE